MKKIYLLSLFAVLLASCHVSRVEYVGSRNSPTRDVDVFVDEQSIKKEYDIVGKGIVKQHWRGKANHEKIMKKAVDKARQYGADAVFFRETFIPSPGTTIQTSSRADSLGTSVFTKSNTSVVPTYGYFRSEMLFLKYK